MFTIVDSARCDGCGLCAEACAEGAITIYGGRPRLDASRCNDCGVCATVCPFGLIRQEQPSPVAIGASAARAARPIVEVLPPSPQTGGRQPVFWPIATKAAPLALTLLTGIARRWLGPASASGSDDRPGPGTGGVGCGRGRRRGRGGGCRGGRRF